MLAPEFTLCNDFPPADYAAWRSLAEADLDGASFEQRLVTHTYEGIDLQPVYGRRDWPGEGDPVGFPGLPPFVRGARPLGAVQTGWDLRQEHAHPDLDATNRAILDDLQGGVTSLLLRLDVAGRNGLDPDDPGAGEWAGRDGMMVYHADDLDRALAGVHLNMIGVTLEAGAAFLPAAALLVALWRRRGVTPEQAQGAFNADPLAVLARDGQLPVPADAALALMADLAAWTAKNYPNVTAVRVGTAPYHHAGATAAQDIAFGMATGGRIPAGDDGGPRRCEHRRRRPANPVQHQRRHASLSGDRQAPCRPPAVGQGRRGVRRFPGVRGDAAPQPDQQARPDAARPLRQPAAQHGRLLRRRGRRGRGDHVGAVRFRGRPSARTVLSRRIARNTVLILQEEAHLNRVIDPPGGSWYLDWLTDQVAEKAWAIFQEIERDGGMLQAIQSGWVAKQIDSAFAPRAKNLARRKEGITGVSEFPNVGEAPVVRPAPDRDALRDAATARVERSRRGSPALTELAYSGVRARPAFPSPRRSRPPSRARPSATCRLALGFHAEPTLLPPLTPHPFAEPFEELRDASDSWQAVHGRRPRVFLANMGPVAHHTARATYAKNFFEAGGFEVVGNDGFRDADAAAKAFAESGAAVAVLCSSDKLYPTVVPETAPKLKAAGARSVVLAGNPAANEAAWRAAGVDRFIFIKCDVLATLRDMLREEGVLIS